MSTAPKNPETPSPTAAEADEQRAKFKAALDAKKGKSGTGSVSHEPGGGGPVKDHSSRSGGKREFRRKSGG